MAETLTVPRITHDLLAPPVRASGRMLIEAEGLVKKYKTGETEVKALDGLDLTVEEGTVLGLLGPNGAGKTTTVRILATLLHPDSGSARVGGYDVVKQAEQVRGMIGLSGQYASVDESLTGRENLFLFGRLYGLSKSDAWLRADQLLEQFDLIDAGSRIVKTYSGGMRRRLDLAGALTGRPRLLVLDEPTTGLDPRSRLGMWEVIRERVREGTTILLTTQYLEEADELAHSIAVVDHGRIIARGTADQLKSQIGGERIEIVVSESDDLQRAVALLGDRDDGDCSIDEHTRKITAPAHGGVERLSAVINAFNAHNIPIDDIGLRRPTLDDVFLTLTGRAAELENGTNDIQGRSSE
ncbi:daunorubicin resistance protein DrrA family ABC transporter ATP-binding protein [soil metagenome]